MKIFQRQRKRVRRKDKIMAFDFKKEFKEFYLPNNKPQIVLVPPANYIAVRGKGDPNEEGGAYKRQSACSTPWPTPSK